MLAVISADDKYADVIGGQRRNQRLDNSSSIKWKGTHSTQANPTLFRLDFSRNTIFEANQGCLVIRIDSSLESWPTNRPLN